MTTVDLRIIQSADDGFDSGDGFPGDSVTSTTQFVGATAADETLDAGARWQNVDIPAGSTINSATITEYRITFDSDGNEQVTLYLQHAASPAAFTAGSDSPKDRYGDGSGFGTGVSWTMGPDGGDNDPEVSPSLVTALQAAVDAASGLTHLVAVMRGVGAVSNAQANFHSWDTDSAETNTMRLQVDYTAGGGGPVAAPVRYGLGMMGVGR